MRQSQNEKRIRILWMGLPENVRDDQKAFGEFANVIRSEQPQLIPHFDGDLHVYLRKVLDGLYKK